MALELGVDQKLEDQDVEVHGDAHEDDLDGHLFAFVLDAELGVRGKLVVKGGGVWGFYRGKLNMYVIFAEATDFNNK